MPADQLSLFLESMWNSIRIKLVILLRETIKNIWTREIYELYIF